MRSYSFLLLVLLAACAQADSSSEQLFSADGQAISLAMNYDVLSYDLKARFDWSSEIFEASVDISIANAQMPEGLVLDSTVEHIASVRAAGVPVQFIVNGERLLINLHGIPTSDPLVLHIEYATSAKKMQQQMRSHLIAWQSPKGDPVPGRFLFTDSEPIGTKAWMPCHGVPSDRAKFHIDFALAENETLITNDTDAPLPTYLMAFAVGDFQITRGDADGVPIAVAHRRGLPFEDEAMLAEIARLMRRFQALLGPYPFNSYTLVLVQGAGMENASITFQDEQQTSVVRSAMSLTAHELGHQWFGDLMTVTSWDDVWIKEGMATLLEGEEFYFGDDAIVDTSLAPEKKYTSGNYGRAAWLYSQLRALVGEDAFWATLRAQLVAHRFGSISTDEMMAAFAPLLPPETLARVVASLSKKTAPALTVTQVNDDVFTLHLTDADDTVIAPVVLQWRTPAGLAREIVLTPNVDVTVAAQAANERLVIDPRAIHPDLALWADYSSEYFALLDRYVSPGADNLFDFLTDARKVQERTLSLGGVRSVTPEAFSTFFSFLPSDYARSTLLQGVCGQLRGMSPELKERWKAPVVSALETLHANATQIFTMQNCRELFATESLFAADLAQLATLSRPEILFIEALPLVDPLATLAPLVTDGPSVSVRADAMRALVSTLRSGALTPATYPAWSAFVLQALESTHVPSVLFSALGATRLVAAPAAADNAPLIAAIVEISHSDPFAPGVMQQALCAVHTLCRDDAACLADFSTSVNPFVLPPTSAETLATGKNCR